LTNGNRNPNVHPPDSKPFGSSHGEWIARWWQWALSIPKDHNPVSDSTGKNCAVNQNGPVWFLAGTSGGSAERSCTIPAGKAMFFPITTDMASFAKYPNLKTESELISNVKSDIDQVKSLELTVDGTKIEGLDKYRVQSPVFDVTIAENNLFEIKAGPTKAASDGYWIFLEALPKGGHTIHFHGLEHDFETEVNYRLTVE
jgi:hypothetical protein